MVVRQMVHRVGESEVKKKSPPLPFLPNSSQYQSDPGRHTWNVKPGICHAFADGACFGGLEAKHSESPNSLSQERTATGLEGIREKFRLAALSASGHSLC